MKTNRQRGVAAIQFFEAAMTEAELIRSRHDGIHPLHYDCRTLAFMAEIAETGASLDLEKAEEILHRIRVTDSTGVYPA